MAVNSALFFKHVDSFISYRRDVYEISEQTLRTNSIDLRLFKDFVKERNYDAITGPAVMAYQYYLKKQHVATESAPRLLLTAALWYLLELKSDYEEEELIKDYEYEYEVYRKEVPGKFLLDEVIAVLPWTSTANRDGGGSEEDD